MSTSNSQIEEEVLTLERQLWQFPDLNALAIRLAALEQQLAASWATAGFGAPPTPTCVTDFPAICACIPISFVIHNSSYGDCTVTYDSVSKSWKGCFLISYAGSGPCTACTTAQHYELVGSNTTSAWSLIFRFKTHLVSGQQCPVASVCTDATNYGVSYNSINVICSGLTSQDLGNAGPFQPSHTVVSWTW